MADKEHIFNIDTNQYVCSVPIGTCAAHPKGEGNKNKFKVKVGRELVDKEINIEVPSKEEGMPPDKEIVLRWGSIDKVLAKAVRNG